MLVPIIRGFIMLVEVLLILLVAGVIGVAIGYLLGVDVPRMLWYRRERKAYETAVIKLTERIRLAPTTEDAARVLGELQALEAKAPKAPPPPRGARRKENR